MRKMGRPGNWARQFSLGLSAAILSAAHHLPEQNEIAPTRQT